MFKLTGFVRKGLFEGCVSLFGCQKASLEVWEGFSYTDGKNKDPRLYLGLFVQSHMYEELEAEEDGRSSGQVVERASNTRLT